MEEKRKTFKKFLHGLTFNVIGSIIVLLLVFQVIVLAIGYSQFTRSLTDEYNESAFRTATTASSLVHGEDIAAFIENAENIRNGEDTPLTATYEECKSRLDNLCTTQDVNVIYIIAVNPDYKSFVSVINCPNAASGYTPWDIGTVVDTETIEDNAFYDLYKDIYENGLARGTVMRTRNLNGVVPHVTSVIPIKDGENVAALLCVQRTMGELVGGRARYMRLVALTTIVIMILGTIIATLYIRRQFIKPVKDISKEATRFAAENSAPENPISTDKIKITELSELVSAVNGMERDTLKYIANLSSAISEKQRMGTELNIARRIQEGLVPSIFPAFPDRKEFDLFASMTPAKEVGGDFYNFFFTEEDKLAFVIADVSGKGVPAALFMMATMILVKERAELGGTPAEILYFLNDRICANNKAEMFVTMWLGVIDLKTGRITAANAGHDDPAVYRKDGRFEIVKNKHNLVVGAMEGVPYRNFEIQLNKGDKIFLYTDGVPEATDINQKMFTINGMINALNKTADGSPEEVLSVVKTDVENFVGDAPQFDDLTMLCLEYKGYNEEDGEKKIKLRAVDENLPKAIDFITEFFEKSGASQKTVMQMQLVAEEVFVNVAHYAYEGGVGDVEITMKKEGEKAVVIFTDRGKPYDPLFAPEPDVTLSAEERQIGGLGVFMTKKMTDDISYRYEDGKNILTLEKKLD